ncbi:MAG: type II secretion system protein [Victivallaceae bacterium]
MKIKSSLVIWEKFTLVELVVALAILGLSLTALLSMFAAGRQRMGKAAENWRNMHMLSQAAEYILLHDTTSTNVPEQFFPYEDYTLYVSYEDIDNLPEELVNKSGQLELRGCRIDLIRYQDKKVVDSLIVDRIIYNSDDSYQVEEQ